MVRFDMKALLRVTVAVAAAALLLRANINGSPQARLTATLIYCGLMLGFAYYGYRRRGKNAMMPEEGTPEKHAE